MASPAATVSTNSVGQPDIGPEIITVSKSIKTPKRRALIGWNHQNDNPNSLCSGKIWCWVSEGGHLQVYDENYNRSKNAGEVRFCGVANFTMVRMFHPYWSLFGRAPRDMKSKDKEGCRVKYLQLMRRWRVDHGLPVDDDSDNEIQPDEDDEPRRKKRGRPSRRSRGGRAPRPGGRRRRRQQREATPVVTGVEEQTPGYAVTAPLAISDEEDSDWNDDIPLAQRSGTNAGRATVGNMDNVASSICGDNRPDQGTEDAVKDDIKEEDETQETTQSTNATNPVPAGSRARSIFTPLLNPLPDETTQADATQQTIQTNPPALMHTDDYDTHFDALLQDATVDSLDTNQDTTQDTTQEMAEMDDFIRELGAAATAVETETEVKSDEDRVVSWVPCPIVPVGEVIVIDD